MSKIQKTLQYAGTLMTLLLLLHFGISKAQSTTDLRLNEILVHNDSNYVDDYGNRAGWIEVFNTAYNKVNMGGMYLTNDPKNPKKYWIPTGDPVTQIAQRNYLVFFADNHPTRGVLHLNFSLDETNYIALYASDGRTLIDELTFPAIPVDASYGRETDGADNWVMLEKTTPKANNYTGEIITAGDAFVKMDPYGVGMAMIAMTVVFIALILLYIIFKNTRTIYGINLKKVFSKGEKIMPKVKEEEDVIGEVNAAIAMALNLYISDIHDHEETVLTIKKVSRTYSPWSSKIYNLRRLPRQ